MYRKYAKLAIRQKFPTHPIFHHPERLEWHETMERHFRRECERANAIGSEHYGLRWDEGTYDPYYSTLDFDWIIFKQLEGRLGRH